MKRPKAKKPAANSLFLTGKGKGAVTLTTLDDARKWLSSRKSNEQLLEENLKQILDHAEAAENDLSVQRGAEYAKQIRSQAMLVGECCKKGKAHDAALWAILLAQTWMMLRADAAFAKPVRTYNKTAPAIVKPSARPSDEVLAQVVATHRGRKAQAKKLKTSIRTLGRWLTEEK